MGEALSKWEGKNIFTQVLRYAVYFDYATL